MAKQCFFHVGDRVRIRHGQYKGRTGTVCRVIYGGQPLVAVDPPAGSGKFYQAETADVSENMIELLANES